MLTEDQIGQVIDTYRLQMARYEAAARFVEQRLRREFRAAALPVLLSSRAKHPEDLREKLRRRAADGDPRYEFAPLMSDVNRIVTDVAGCRAIVYDPRLEMPAAQVVQRAFVLEHDPDPDEVHRKPSGYRATHLLVPLVHAEVEASIRDAICEAQITSIASHVFNELEHDIRYKMKGVEPGERVGRNLEDRAWAHDAVWRRVPNPCVQLARPTDAPEARYHGGRPVMQAHQLSLDDLARGLEHFGERYDALDVFTRSLKAVGQPVLEQRSGDLHSVLGEPAFLFERNGRVYKLRFHPSGIARVTRAAEERSGPTENPGALGSLDEALHATVLDPLLPSAILGFLVGELLAEGSDTRRVFPMCFDPQIQDWRFYDGSVAPKLREKRREADSALRAAG